VREVDDIRRAAAEVLRGVGFSDGEKARSLASSVRLCAVAEVCEIPRAWGISYEEGDGKGFSTGLFPGRRKFAKRTIFDVMASVRNLEELHLFVTISILILASRRFVRRCVMGFRG
jgi:hypothetical protein